MRSINQEAQGGGQCEKGRWTGGRAGGQDGSAGSIASVAYPFVSSIPFVSTSALVSQLAYPCGPQPSLRTLPVLYLLKHCMRGGETDHWGNHSEDIGPQAVPNPQLYPTLPLLARCNVIPQALPQALEPPIIMPYRRRHRRDGGVSRPLLTSLTGWRHVLLVSLSCERTWFVQPTATAGSVLPTVVPCPPAAAGLTGFAATLLPTHAVLSIYMDILRPRSMIPVVTCN